MKQSRNPARSRPLSRNVRRLMKMARESPLNPAVEKIERPFTARDLAYCDMQGNIFMAAIDQGYAMERFVPVYMNSQLAGIIDYSFSVSGGMETDDVSEFLRIPMLLQSPQLLVDVVMWLNRIVSGVDASKSANLAVVQACLADDALQETSKDKPVEQESPDLPKDMKALADAYEYAYWLGNIYRCECHMHDESSRMVYGAFSERFMRDFYEQMAHDDEVALADCAQEICRRLDMLLVGKLWRSKKTCMNNITEFGTQPGIAEEAAPSYPWPPPRVRFGAGALCFNQGAVNALARAERVTIYVNDNGQMLIVRPSEGNDVPGAEWVHRTGACVRPKAILSSPFVQGLYARMGWRQECDYRAAGTAIQTHTGPILLFALHDTEAVARRKYAPRL